MQSTSPMFLFGLSSAIHLICYFCLLLYLGTKRSQHPRAATIAMIGVGILLLLVVASWLVPPLLGQVLGMEMSIMGHGIFQVLGSMIRFGAMCLIVAAIFVGRQSPQVSDSYSPGEAPVISDNPYVPPSTQH